MQLTLLYLVSSLQIYDDKSAKIFLQSNLADTNQTFLCENMEVCCRTVQVLKIALFESTFLFFTMYCLTCSVNLYEALLN